MRILSPCLGIAVFALLALVVCGGSAPATEVGNTPTTGSAVGGANPSAEKPYTEFRKLVRDYREGVIEYTYLCTSLVDIDGWAQQAPKEVEDAARLMLVAHTANDSVMLDRAIGDSSVDRFRRTRLMPITAKRC